MLRPSTSKLWGEDTGAWSWDPGSPSPSHFHPCMVCQGKDPLLPPWHPSRGFQRALHTVFGRGGEAQRERPHTRSLGVKREAGRPSKASPSVCQAVGPIKKQDNGKTSCSQRGQRHRSHSSKHYRGELRPPFPPKPSTKSLLRPGEFWCLVQKTPLWESPPWPAKPAMWPSWVLA